ncbi:sulfatase family protein [Dyadobacter frigoris]|uniref:Sulfatase n=1 Tax=Dyadobacter frigoris TaxID=2576211 RepID=A0A4U6D315_9BACT|nr:sulfatase [Dyadobacter frigoris]TKT90491.1 sulfatase [Dyadobacter frigoris]GLU51378.1 sulfatase [Dyadobacter frigoris]
MYKKSFATSCFSFLICFSFSSFAQQKIKNTGKHVENYSSEKSRTNLRPNIIFILSDDHAYQAIGAYGNKLARTPNIDRIGKEGALFQNMMVTNAICGPSRATLLTGKYSHMNGYKTNGKIPFNTSQQMFPKLLQQNGYQTAWIGKLHLETVPGGFDYVQIPPGQGDYYNPDFINSKGDTVHYEGYLTDLVTTFSLDWLSKRDQSKPFMMVVGEKATHRNWMPDLQDLGAYDDVEFPIPTTFYDDYKTRVAAGNQDMNIAKTMKTGHDFKIHADYNDQEYNRFTPPQRKIFEQYYDKITAEFDAKALKEDELLRWKFQRYMKDYLSTANSMDRNIGKILDYLDKTGLAKNTVVIYTSDQGFYTGEHGWFDKRFMYEQSLKTPFLMRYPGVTKPGSKINQLAVNIDWAPSILDIAGVKIPANMQGMSILPILKQDAKPDNWRSETYYHYYEYPSPHKVQPHFGTRTSRYKLIRFYGPTDFWELFDLQKDPDELTNVFENKNYKQIVKDMKIKLKRLINQYQDDEALSILSNKKNIE